MTRCACSPGRDSSGVRGIRLAGGDEVISLSVLRHVEATNDEREAYLKYANAKRRGNGDEEGDQADRGERTLRRDATLTKRESSNWSWPRNSC